MEDVEKRRAFPPILGKCKSDFQISTFLFIFYYVHKSRLLNQFLGMLKFLVSFFNFVLFEEMTPPPKKKLLMEITYFQKLTF